MKFVQYIVVRKDLVPIMGVGKTAAQVAHASLGSILENGQLLNTYDIRGWLEGSFVKLVVYVKTKQKLLNLIDKLKILDIRIKLIYDRCLTKLIAEEEDGTTLTCVGVVPLEENNIPKCLKSLQLLEG
jgi:peptidyl-tRNA hydrolase